MRFIFYFAFVLLLSWIGFESCSALNPAIVVVGKISQYLILKMLSKYVLSNIFGARNPTIDAEFTIEKLNEVSKQMKDMSQTILNHMEKKETKSKYEISKIELYKYIETVNIYYDETFYSIFNVSMNLDPEIIKEYCQGIKKKDGRLQSTLHNLRIHAKNYLKAYTEDLWVIFIYIFQKDIFIKVTSKFLIFKIKTTIFLYTQYKTSLHLALSKWNFP